MIDWDDIIKSENPDELKELKVWLFKEFLRLENLKSEFQESRNKFIKERAQFRDEMDKLNNQSITERKRLKEEKMFFEKKMAILQAGFSQLEEDRRKFEAEKKKYQQGKQSFSGSDRYSHVSGEAEMIAELLFRSASVNSLMIRKRYKDLVKIYHPDNLFGDEELMQAINKVYIRKKKEI